MDSAPEKNSEAEFPADPIPCGKAAGILRASPTTVWRWVVQGRIPGWRVGRRLYVSEADVRAQIVVVASRPVTREVRPVGEQAKEMEAAMLAVLRRHGLA